MSPEDLAATDHGASRLSEISSLEDDMWTALVPANIRALGGKIVSANEEDDEIEIHGPGLRDCEPREHPITDFTSLFTDVKEEIQRNSDSLRKALAKLWII